MLLKFPKHLKFPIILEMTVQSINDIPYLNELFISKLQNTLQYNTCILTILYFISNFRTLNLFIHIK